MIKPIHSTESRYKKPVSFTGYGTVGKIYMHKASNRLIRKTFNTPNIHFVDNLAQRLEKTPEEFKAAANIDNDLEQRLNHKYGQVILSMFQKKDTFKQLPKKERDTAIDNILTTGVRKLLQEEQLIDENHNFFTLQPKFALVKPGKDFIDDDLTKLADCIIVRGNVKFDKMNAKFINLSNVKNKKLKVKADEAYINNSEIHSIYTTGDTSGNNVKAKIVESDGRISIGGTNEIQKVWAYEQIVLDAIKAKTIRSEKSSVFINENSNVDYIDAYKNFVSANDLTAGQIYSQTGAIQLWGSKNTVGLIENEGEIHALNLTADEVTSHKGSVDYYDQKNNVKKTLARGNITGVNLSGESVKSQEGIITLNGEQNNIKTAIAHGNLVGTNLIGNTAESETGSIILNGDNNALEKLSAKYGIIAHNLTADSVESANDFVYLFGKQNAICEIKAKTSVLLSGMNNEPIIKTQGTIINVDKIEKRAIKGETPIPYRQSKSLINDPTYGILN